MCKVCGFTLCSGQIRVKSEKPEDKKKKKKANLGVRLVLGFGLNVLSEVQQEMQCFMHTSAECV